MRPAIEKPVMSCRQYASWSFGCDRRRWAKQPALRRPEKSELLQDHVTQDRPLLSPMASNDAARLMDAARELAPKIDGKR
jgi:hypothetical protein